MEQLIPQVAVVVPAAQVLDARERGSRHACAQSGIVGELLQALGECGAIAVRHNEAFDAIGEEVFCASGRSGNDRTAAGHRLSLHKGEALLDAGQGENVAARHARSELGLRKYSGKGYVFRRKVGQDPTHIVEHSPDQGEMLARVAQRGEGLQQIRDAFAQADLSGEENLEAVGGRRLGWLEAVETHAVGDDVNLVGREAFGEERPPRDRRGNCDGVRLRVDRLFALDDVGGRRGEGDLPAAILLGHHLILEALMRGSAIADELAAA